MNFFSTLKRFGLITLAITWTLPTWAADMQLRIIQTSDVQAQLTDFDYENEQNNPRFGYTRTATLIKQAQREVKNSFYVDNGNILQGSPMGDYMLNKGLEVGEKHPSYLALEKAGALATVIGRRELMHDLDYLDKAVASSSVPVLSANLFDVQTRAPRYKPYQFKIMELIDNTGAKRRVNVALIGLTSSHLLNYQPTLQGKVLVSDAVLTAQKYVPLLRQLGAEVIIALNQSPENQVALSQVAGLDAVLWTGELAPFGAQIGVLDLHLSDETGRWRVLDSQFATRAIFDEREQKSLARNQFRMKWHLHPYHQATRQFMTQPIGKKYENLYSYLSWVKNDVHVKSLHAEQQTKIYPIPNWMEVRGWLACSAGVFKQVQAASHHNCRVVNSQTQTPSVKKMVYADKVFESQKETKIEPFAGQNKKTITLQSDVKINYVMRDFVNKQTPLSYTWLGQDAKGFGSYQFDLKK